MSKIIERCAGIDIGNRFLLCCALTGASHEEPRSETRRVDTTVPELERLREWLQKEAVTHCSALARRMTHVYSPKLIHSNPN